jgi:glycosyltransferase involved in cell wall biosynthesis
MSTRPDISFIMPCYNESEVIGYTIPKMLKAFRDAGYRLELVAVDNGSQDDTGEILQRFAAGDSGIVPVRVDVNEGYGNGVLKAIPHCSASWIGIIPADGQVDAEDVVRLYESASATNGKVVAKVHRRFRLDGVRREIISFFYNLVMRILWPRLGSFDVNGSPKIIRREFLHAMELKSKGWFLDPELMVKAHYMGLRTLELNVFARMREHGSSHVRTSTCLEFLRDLLAFRFTGKYILPAPQVTVERKAAPGATARHAAP